MITNTVSQFYMDLQIREFQEWGKLEFSNPDFLPEYEKNLQARQMKYKIVRGLGDYGITIAICTPANYQKYKRQLNYEIKRAEDILAAKKAAREELTP